MKGVALGVVLGIGFSIVVACGGATPEPGIDEKLRDKLRKENEITALWTQIREFRHDARMPLDPPRALMFQYQALPVQQVMRVCTDGHAVPKTCDDVCDLSDSICDNAEAICGLADELGKDDTFAQEKCASAKASCRESKQRCCDCSGGVQ